MNKVILGEENSQEREVELREVDYGKERRWFLGDTSFDGHHELWGFDYHPHNYMKESELSGDQYRKAGWIKFYRNRVQVYEQFCREPDVAVRLIPKLLMDLQSVDWSKVKEGTKIYYERTPAVIGHVMMDQGAFMIHPDGVDAFPDSIWAEEDYEKNEEPDSLKVDVLDPKIWWWRN